MATGAQRKSLTVWMSPKDKERLSACAEKLKLSENDLAREAVLALIECVEANNFEILWPPKITLKGDKRVMVL